MPYLRWPDVETLLYGAEDSKLYGPEDPQGMESDTAVYLQNAVDAASLDGSTQGRWRVFSKLGLVIHVVASLLTLAMHVSLCLTKRGTSRLIGGRVLHRHPDGRERAVSSVR